MNNDKNLNKTLREWKKYDKKINKKSLRNIRSQHSKKSEKLKINHVKLSEELNSIKRTKKRTELFENTGYLESFLKHTENKTPYKKYVKPKQICKGSIKNLYLGWAKCNWQNLLIWIFSLILILMLCYYGWILYKKNKKSLQ